MTLALHSRITGTANPPHDPSGAGAPVILLHGLFGSLENLGVVERKLARNYPIHSLDLRNHGRSPHAPGMSYAEMADDLLAYLDAHDLQQVVLIGHSMGGKAAMRLALEHPDRVAGLIVADIAPVQYQPHHAQILEGLRELASAQLDSRTQADQLLQDHLDEAPVRQFLLKNLVKNEQGHFVLRLNLDAIEKGYKDIMAGEDASRSYPGPVLFIKGGASDYIQEQHRAKIGQLFPAAAVRVIPEVGHWLHAEKPAIFTSLCERFLSGDPDLSPADN